MLILITGSRYYTNKESIENEIKKFSNDNLLIIHGGCKGADLLAEHVCKKLDIKTKIYQANWSLGLKAGPLRNIEMLNQKPDLVLAFHENISESKGTKHVISECQKRNIPFKLFC